MAFFCHVKIVVLSSYGAVMSSRIVNAVVLIDFTLAVEAVRHL